MEEGQIAGVFSTRFEIVAVFIKKTVKDEKRKHVTNLVASRCLNPRLLSVTIESFLNAPQTDFT